MARIPVAALRRMLTVGTEFVGTYCGAFPNGTITTSRRRVKSQSARQMSSEILDGPKCGRLIYCNWHGVTVREEGGTYILTDNGGGAHDFLRVTSIVRAAVAVLLLVVLSGCATNRQALVVSWEPLPEARVAYMLEIGGDRD